MVTVKISLIILFLIPVAMAATKKLDFPPARKPALDKEKIESKENAPTHAVQTSQNRFEQIHAKKSRQNQEEERK